MSFLKIFVRLQTEKNMRDVLIEVVRFVLSLQSECIEKQISQSMKKLLLLSTLWVATVLLHAQGIAFEPAGTTMDMFIPSMNTSQVVQPRRFIRTAVLPLPEACTGRIERRRGHVLPEMTRARHIMCRLT